MTASSFNATPGLSISHSKDMINYKLINHVLSEQIPLPASLFTAETNITLVPEQAKAGKATGLIIMDLDYTTLSIPHNETVFFPSTNQSYNLN